LDYFQQKMLILQLQGFIFFGSSHSVYRSTKDLIDKAENAPMFLILDMRLVQGIDSSATTALVKMATLTRDHNAGLIVVPGSDAVRASLEHAGLNPEHFDHLRVFDRFDEAVEFCEDRILVEARTQIQRRGTGRADDAFLDAVFGDVMAGLEVQEEFEELVAVLRDRMDEVDSRVGTVLYAQHDENRDLFFIVTGLVSLERIDAHDRPMRIRTLGAWNILGEMGALLSYREPFTARVVRSGDILTLSPEVLAAIASEDPELNRRLQHLIIQMLGSELARTSQVLARP
jgi:SulP family sulfate permease